MRSCSFTRGRVSLGAYELLVLSVRFGDIWRRALGPSFLAAILQKYPHCEWVPVRISLMSRQALSRANCGVLAWRLGGERQGGSFFESVPSWA
jgi:hypothetical protein